MATYKVVFLKGESKSKIEGAEIKTFDAHSFSEAESKVKAMNNCIRVLNSFEERYPNSARDKDSIEERNTFTCYQDKCGKEFNDFYRRMRHMQSEHRNNSTKQEQNEESEKSEQHECEYCNAKFPSEQSLNGHKANCSEKPE